MTLHLFLEDSLRCGNIRFRSGRLVCYDRLDQNGFLNQAIDTAPNALAFGVEHVKLAIIAQGQARWTIYERFASVSGSSASHRLDGPDELIVRAEHNEVTAVFEEGIASAARGGHAAPHEFARAGVYAEIAVVLHYQKVRAVRRGEALPFGELHPSVEVPRIRLRKRSTGRAENCQSGCEK